MIQTLIIEDESAAAKRLQKMLLQLVPDMSVIAVIVSVKSAVEWFKKNPAPQLVFMDINLADGNSFDIFKQVQVEAPIIFITAYDQFAIDAFKVNSVDYLLKPIKIDALTAAIEKFKKLYYQKNIPPINIQQLLADVQQPQPQYKERFVIRYGDHIKSIETADIAYFYTQNRGSYAITKDGKRHLVDYNLDQLETLLSPTLYFRINRQFIIGYNAIAAMSAHTKSRVLIQLQPVCATDTIVSSERAAAFKAWLNGEK